MKLTAFSAGKPKGNCEIFVKEALMAAEAKGVEVEFIRLSDCDLHNCRSCVQGACPSTKDPTKCPYGKDDAVWLMEKFLDSDGYIIAAPAYSLSSNSLLFTFRDRVFGPRLDCGMVLAGHWPEPEWAHGRFKSRPGGLIGVGGAGTEHWTSLNIPSLFTTTFSAKTNVVDTLNVYGVADKFAAAVEDAWLTKAHKLGENVADAMLTGDHRWRGEQEGTCPFCHQNLLQVVPGTDQVICPICGILGNARIQDGVLSVEWPDDDEHRKDNRLEVRGSVTHMEEIFEIVQTRYKPNEARIMEACRKWHDYTACEAVPPSRRKKA